MSDQVETVLSFPRLNEPAPEFEATTTHGPKKLSDYKGKWVILFSHPADFTPVCTTEFVAFTGIYPELQKRGVDLIGLSIDSNFSHIAWVRNIEEKLGVKIPFPIIADIDMKVASKYGMVHPGASNTQAVRAVFIIDDKGVLRAMLYYPMSNGRNMDEILRLVDALQTLRQVRRGHARQLAPPAQSGGSAPAHPGRRRSARQRGLRVCGLVSLQKESVAGGKQSAISDQPPGAADRFLFGCFGGYSSARAIWQPEMRTTMAVAQPWL
jgi:peroxiredoxin (alkyl hydroperoxide reductase subunit C)